VKYRHKTKEGNLSPEKKEEFELDKELYYDGPGAWKDICRNMIAYKTGLNKSDIMDDSLLRFECKGKINSNSSSTSSNNSNNSNNASWENNTTRETNNESSNSENNQPRVSYSKCSFCGDKYVIGDGSYAYLKKDAKVYKHNFCSNSCFSDKLASGDYIQVDENGLTSSERSDNFFKKIRQENETKRIEKEKERKETRLAIKIGIPVLVLAIVYFIYSNNEMTKQKSEAVRINLELEQIEDSVKLYINSGNYDRALILTNQLVHPLNELYEGKGSVWEGEYYNLYWDKKREEFKNIIIDRGTMETEANKNSSKSKSSSDKAKSKKNKSKNNSSKKNPKPKKNKSKTEKNSEVRIEIVPDSDEDLDDIYR
jgi:ribosomal protein L24E